MSASQLDEKAIFNQVKRLQPSPEREKELRAACRGDKALFQRVAELLRAHDHLTGFLETPAVHRSSADTLVLGYHEQPGEVIGPYKLVKELGKGGMGVVYEAEQHEPIKRHVALKIIQHGTDTCQEVIRRFEAERQALALMDHPHIAKVLDAGATNTGRPYFVMELVRGVPITEYCDQKNHTLRERLELFLPVCQAIQHAHHKGIVHRDIKPSNVLVAEFDGKPVPKVIDFGVAKALSDNLTQTPLNTRFGQIIGTLEYMSPEQAQLNPHGIDTRSDIYSLGILLYELLTGMTPFDQDRLRWAAVYEVLRIICEEESPKPSTKLSKCKDRLPSISAQRHTEPAKLARLVRGDLDWIVMKALEKQPDRRYQSPSDLANDITNYLTDQPIAARKPSRWYQFRKFAKRHWLGVGVGVFTVLCLLATTIVSAGFARWAYAERDGAIAARNESTRTAALEKIQRIRLTDRSAGWSGECLKLLREATKTHPHPEDKNISLDILQGTDMRLVKQWDGFDCGSIRFRPDSKGFVAVDLRGGEQLSGIRMSTGLGESLPSSQKPILGPVRIVKGQAMGIRLIPNKRALALRSLESEFQGPECVIPQEAPGNLSSLTLSDSGGVIACLITSPQKAEEGQLLAWDAQQGKVRLRETLQNVSAVAIAPDERLLVTGHKDGRLTAFDLETGKRLGDFSTGRLTVNIIAFTPNRKCPQPADAKSFPHWTFATGTTGGEIKVWDFGETLLLRANLSGGNFDVYALDFNPDGTILASAGRYHVRLWDVATATPILRLEPLHREGSARNYLLDLDFSPDGNRLAVGCMAAFGYPGGIDIWEFDAKRPIRPLRGLSGQMEKIAYSQDGHRVAALSHDWRIGVWNTQNGQLHQVWDVPQGLFTDNADLAFDPSGNQLAFSTFRDAMILDLETGRTKSSWKLPPGLTDRLSFYDSKTLYLLRVETGASGKVSRIRNLLADPPLEPIYESLEHNLEVVDATVAGQGHLFVIDGYRANGNPPQRLRSLIAVNAATQSRLWSQDSQEDSGGLMLRANTTGSQIAALMDADGTARVLDARNGEVAFRLAQFPSVGFSPDATLSAGFPLRGKGCTIYRKREEAPWLILNQDDRLTAGRLHDSGSLKRIVWGNAAGELYVAQLPGLEDRLETISLP